MIKDTAKDLFNAAAPKLSHRLKFYRAHGYWPNMSQPKSFYEKLSALKFGSYPTNPYVLQFIDKLEVRNYVKAAGLEGILTTLYGVYDNLRDIDYDELPSSFCIKATLGNGCNYFCSNKTLLDKKDFEADIALLDLTWKKRKRRLMSCEKSKVNRFLVEEYLGDLRGNAPEDYKFYCFSGHPSAVLVYKGRKDKIPEEGAMISLDWEILNKTWWPKREIPLLSDENLKPPIQLQQMINIAEKLSEPLPFLRVDLYAVGEKVYFGELTPFPAGCVRGSEASINGKNMGELLDLHYLGKDWIKPER